MRRPEARLVRFTYRSPLTPARVARLLRAPSLADRVAGRAVLVTGSSSGIGRAVALRLAAAGAKVLLVARSVDALQAVRTQIAAAGGSAELHPCDLRDLDAVDRLAADVLERHGCVDLLINNAGRSIRRPIDESYDRLHDFERCMRLNYFSPMQLTLGLLPPMRARGFGHVINVSTMGVQTNGSRFSAYLASKAALDAFSRSLAIEARADGVRVTTIHPPLVHTPMSAASGFYDDKPGLTADEAAGMIVEAIRTRCTRIAPRLGRAFEVARLLAPSALQACQSSAYRRSESGTGSIEREDDRPPRMASELLLAGATSSSARRLS
jgi:NAD(P)-dependent dehydrogenase (short-subunit alcohol dehydrogenase family)